MIYVLYTLLSILIAIFTFIAGYCLGYKLHYPKKKTKYIAKENEINDAERRKVERMKKELANMLSYTGDKQEEINVD